MRTMKPVTHELFVRDTLCLRDFGFVVRKNVVDTAAVNIELIAEQGGSHGAALNVPTGSAAAPWAIPRYVTIFFVPGFPEREIPHVLLVVFVMFNPTGGLQLSKIEMGELP